MYFILLCVWMWFKGLENPCTNVQGEQSQNWPYAISLQSWQPKRVTRVTRARQATDVLMGIVVRPATDGVAILRVIARKNGTSSSIIIPKFSHVTRLEPPLTPAFCDVQISYADFLAFLIFAFLIFLT